MLRPGLFEQRLEQGQCIYKGALWVRQLHAQCWPGMAKGGMQPPDSSSRVACQAGRPGPRPIWVVGAPLAAARPQGILARSPLGSPARDKS